MPRPLRLLFLSVAVVLLLGGCSRPSRIFHEQLYVFGTLVDVSIWGNDPALAEKAMKAVNADFQWMNVDWHPWKGDGALIQFNRACAAGKPYKVPADLLPLIIWSQKLYTESDGLFNAAIGQLIALWGFHSDVRPDGPPPTKAEIAALVAKNPTPLDIHLKGDIATCSNPAVSLDFGGYAKGYAADYAIAHMQRLGVKNAIVNLGGGMHVLGRHGDRPWRIGIRHPQGDGVIGAIDVRSGESVHTSGNYERYHEYMGKRYAHIIDPRDGWPVDHVVSTTVISNDGTLTDAAATALTVAGPKEWRKVAHDMGVHDVMLVDEKGTVYMTPSMAKRVQFEGKKPAHIVIVKPL